MAALDPANGYRAAAAVSQSSPVHTHPLGLAQRALWCAGVRLVAAAVVPVIVAIAVVVTTIVVADDDAVCAELEFDAGSGSGRSGNGQACCR